MEPLEIVPIEDPVVSEWRERALKAEARLGLVKRALQHLLRKNDWDSDFTAVEDFGYQFSVTFDQADWLQTALTETDDVRNPPRTRLQAAAIRAAGEFEGLEMTTWAELHRLILDELAELARQDRQETTFARHILPLMISALVEESK